MEIISALDIEIHSHVIQTKSLDVALCEFVGKPIKIYP